MKKKRWIIILVVFFVIPGIGVGVKRYMEKQELVEIQKDLAGYLYNNYRLYTRDKDKVDAIYKEFDKGNGNLTEEEYLKKMKDIREYSDIEKIEFTGLSISPMGALRIELTINGVYETAISSGAISAETGKLIFNISGHSGKGPYYLEELQEKTKEQMLEESISYYRGEIK